MDDMSVMFANVDSDVLIANINGGAHSDLRHNKVAAFIDALLDVFQNDSEMRVMLIKLGGEKEQKTGNIDRECSGISVIKNVLSSGSKETRFGSIGTSQICSHIREIDKPIVIAHQSLCSGDNLLVALSCDFRIAEADAVYEFYDKGHRDPPTSDAVKPLVDVVGAHWARLLVMANMPLTAREAHTAGLVHKVFPGISFDQDVLNFCRHIASQGPENADSAKRKALH